jgi:Protein of unknown function (DUF2934)
MTKPRWQSWRSWQSDPSDLATQWGKHPMARCPVHQLTCRMKHNHHTQDRQQKPEDTANLPAATPVSEAEINFVPAPEEVARKAYFSYVNQGSSSGHEVQHWLAAESELIAERNRTRKHGFHNKS